MDKQIKIKKIMQLLLNEEKATNNKIDNVIEILEHEDCP